MPINGSALHKMPETNPSASAQSVIFAPVCTGGVQTNHITPEELTGTRDIVAEIAASKVVGPAVLDYAFLELKKWLEKNPRVLREVGEQVLLAVNSQRNQSAHKS
jgi:hypothetical protein